MLKTLIAATALLLSSPLYAQDSVVQTLKDQIGICIAYKGNVGALQADLNKAKDIPQAWKDDTAKTCAAFVLGIIYAKTPQRPVQTF